MAGPLFTAAFLVQGAVRAGYDPRRHPVSSLALGRGGWVQTLNFTLAGALYLAGAVGLARARWTADAGSEGVGRSVPVLIAAAAFGLIGAGAFVTDPVSGFPPGTPDSPDRYSTSGALHDLLSVLTFLGVPAAAPGAGYQTSATAIIVSADHRLERGRFERLAAFSRS